MFGKLLSQGSGALGQVSRSQIGYDGFMAVSRASARHAGLRDKLQVHLQFLCLPRRE